MILAKNVIILSSCSMTIGLCVFKQISHESFILICVKTISIFHFSTRVALCDFWKAIVEGDEPAMKTNSAKLGVESKRNV